jgi:hypothetical protein
LILILDLHRAQRLLLGRCCEGWGEGEVIAYLSVNFISITQLLTIDGTARHHALKFVVACTTLRLTE